MKNFSQNSVKIALCGVVGSERVWDSYQQAKSVRQAIARMGRFTEMGTRFPCLLRLSRIINKNSYPDFFGIMTSYQECCIYAVSLKKGRNNMEYFLLNSDFFKRYNSGKKSG